MKRTTLSLPDDLADALTREARRRSTSASAVARDALASHLKIAPTEARPLPFAALGRSGHRTTGRDMEELLVREWADRGSTESSVAQHARDR
ncbi:MAG: CopG family transcriptional regulator [Solirubrobacterales bacterium]